MRTTFGLSLLVGAGLVLAAGPVTAQEPTRTDSLEVQLRRLQARIDSLQQVVERLLQQGREAGGEQDELARLRAAAQAAAGARDTTQRTAPQPQGRRNLNQLNPEISVTGDVRVQTDPDAWAQDNIEVKEVEFSFQAALDPFASTKIFFGFEEGEVHLEEAYLYWTGLPGNVRLDLGRLRQQAGELNRWHLHALPESNYPLVYQTYFGEEGLVGDGIRLFWLAPTSGVFGVQELTLEGTVGGNEVLYQEGNRPSGLAHLNNFFQLSPSTFLQVGGTAARGENPDVNLETTTLGADFRFTWQPPAQAQRKSFTLRGEGYWVDQEIADAGEAAFGGFLGAMYQLSRQWYAGARYDYVEPIGGGRATWAVVPHLTWWQSEFAYINAEWQHVRVPDGLGGRDAENRILLQVVWSIGPHKHETY